VPAIVDYDAIKAGVVQWVRDTAGEFLYVGQDGLGAVWWVEDAHDYQIAPYVELTWNDGGSQGQDAVVWREVAADTLSPRMIGLRQVVVGVEVRARGDVNVPRQVAEALRTSFDNELTAVVLQESYGLSPVRVESFSAGGGFMWEGRLEAVSSMELRFSYQTVADNASLTVERIRNVGLSNQVKNAVGDIVGENEEVLVGFDYPITLPGSGNELPTLSFTLLEWWRNTDGWNGSEWKGQRSGFIAHADGQTSITESSLNGIPVLNFAGTGGAVPTATDSALLAVFESAYTVVGIVTNVGQGNSAHALFQAHDGGLNNYLRYVETSTSVLRHRVASTNFNVTDGALDKTSPRLVAASFDGTTAQLWVNGVSTASDTLPSLVGTNLAQFIIGDSNTNAGPWEGLIADILIYPGALTASDHIQLNTYFKSRYALP
jgi:hypothetical protein